MKRTRTGIALLILSHGLVACGEHGSPSAPSAPTAPSVQQPSPQPNPIRLSRPRHLMKVLRAVVHGQPSPALTSNQAPR